MGSRMQHGSAQPTAAHALQGKRNARVVRCDKGNAQPAAAHAPHSNEIHWSMSTPWCHTFVVLVLLVTYVIICHAATPTNEISVTAGYASWWNEFRSIMLLLDIILGEINNITGKIHWTSITHAPQQIGRLPLKINLMIDRTHIWNVIYNARSNKNHPPTSANTAPATQNESHNWSPSHMKRHLQCAAQQEPSSNFSKYCACHAKWIS